MTRDHVARHIVVGTAGHVDHGKTALVKALTGTDTDRWAEEKRRGITIDLGFARVVLGDDLSASIVDVPGHEDFIRNMVAGATGIDIALLVVAADEGPMPQTHEHLAILEFLGIQAGAVAVTKTDLVEAEWLNLVLDDLGARLSASPIRWETPVPVSSISGAGLDALRTAMAHAARDVQAGDPTDLFRLPVDRVFSMAGAGTVVTGTAWDGSVAVGADVQILPEDIGGRVRSIEVHGEPAKQALPGRRTALALAGVDRAQAPRGSVVVRSSDGWMPTRTVDVRVQLLPTARALGQRSRVRFHLGTAEVMARVTPSADPILPGKDGVVRLRLEEPVVARWGDRGVLRSYSPVTTIAGCVVVDPWPDARPRRPPGAAARWSADPAARLAYWTRQCGTHGLPLSGLPVRLGVHPASASDLVGAAESNGLVSASGRVFDRVLVTEAAKRALAALERYHREHPMQPGMPHRAFQRAAGAGPLAALAEAHLSEQGTIVAGEGVVWRADHHAAVTGRHAEDARALEGALVQAGSQGVEMTQVAQIAGESAGDLIEFVVRQGTALRVGQSRYYHTPALADLVRKTVERLGEEGEATPAELREVLGLSRKYLIPLLEWFDSHGVTTRIADTRRLGPGAHQVLEALTLGSPEGTLKLR